MNKSLTYMQKCYRFEALSFGQFSMVAKPEKQADCLSCGAYHPIDRLDQNSQAKGEH